MTTKIHARHDFAVRPVAWLTAMSSVPYNNPGVQQAFSLTADEARVPHLPGNPSLAGKFFWLIGSRVESTWPCMARQGFACAPSLKPHSSVCRVKALTDGAIQWASTPHGQPDDVHRVPAVAIGCPGRKTARANPCRFHGPRQFVDEAVDQVWAASPMLSTPRSSRTVLSQLGSISGTEESRRSV